MIQRLQTVYLFIASVLVVVTNLFPLAHFKVGEGAFYTVQWLGVQASGVEEFSGTGVWSILATCTTAAAFVLLVMTIFGYKNRIKQMKMCVYAILVLLVFYVFFGLQLWTVYSATQHYPDLGLIAQLPLIAIILIFMAGRAIKRDEDLVRAADRIR